MQDPNQGNEGGSGGGKKHHHKKHGGGGGGTSGGGGNGDGGGSGGSGGGGSNYNAGSYSDRVHYAYSWLVNHGLSPNAAAGVVGNLVAESSVDPNANQAGGPGMGIAQWSEGGRWEALKAWANGKNIYSLDTQLGFLWHELQTGYRGVLTQLQNTTNMADATKIFMTQFEIPSDQSAAAIQGRVQLAENVRSSHNPNMDTSGGTGGGAAESGGYGSSSGGGGFGKKDNLTPSEMAERYGWAMSFLKSEPELWDLFQTAVKHNWSPQQFAAKLRDTKWFQHNSETVRKNELLKSTDPATYADRLHEIKAQLADIAAGMGANLSDKQLQRVADNALMFGWSDAQIQNTLADYVSRVKGSFTGSAGDNEDQLRAWARDMGVHVSNQYLKNAVSSIASGSWDLNGAKDRLTKIAMSQFPALRDDLKNGGTVMDSASGYINSMATILELNPSEIDLFNPKIRRALGTKNMDGKPEMKSIWEFENDLRNDPAWLKTHNAADAIGGAARKVLTDFGILG